MTDGPADPHPDSPPRDDDRGSIEQVDDGGGHDRDPGPDDLAPGAAPDADNGSVGGTDGVVKNQDDTAQ